MGWGKSYQHFLYVVATEPDGPVKIGISGDFMRRLAGLRTSCSWPPKIVHVFVCPTKKVAGQAERSFHQAFAEYRTNGEWFSLNPQGALQLLCAHLRKMMKDQVAPADLEEVELAAGITGAERKIEWIEKNPLWWEATEDYFSLPPDNSTYERLIYVGEKDEGQLE